MNDTHEWILEFKSPAFGEAIQLPLVNEIIIGRNDARTERKADIDLGPHEAAAKGVSRNHARIYTDGTRLLVQDMGTSNGTVLNGQNLNPDSEYIMTGEDSLILGAFRMSVVAVQAPENAFENLNTADAKKQTGKLGEEQHSILIVEDHVEVAQLFSMILQKKGYKTQISRDANRAMRYLTKNRPDAVILDLMLPGMNGTEVCRYIRRDSSLDQTAVIIVSANRNAGIERATYDAGADAFVSKPVNAEELSSTVKNIISKRKMGQDITRELSDSDSTKALSEEQAMEAPLSVHDDTVAIVVAGYTERPFTVTVNRPMTFGRGAYATPATHVDLSRFSAGDKGVSRMHIRMIRQDGKFFVQDMDSMNGTYINGEKIPPNKPHELKSGQELRMGQLAMNVYFATAEEAEQKAATD